MQRFTLMHRWIPRWLAIVVTVTVFSTGCTSGSVNGKSTSLASDTPPAVSGSGSIASRSAPLSVDVAADVFTCPSAAEINALTAKGFIAAVGNGAGHCEYVVATGSTQAVRVTIDHPPTAATSTQETLAQFRTAFVVAGNVVLEMAPQYSVDSFIARFGTLSCSVFALARDGEVMQVQASHQTPVPLDDCSLAQSVTAVAGTSSRPAASATPAAPGEVGVSPTAVSPAESTSVAPSSSPSTRASATAPGTRPPTKQLTAPTSASEVLIFSTGPAASLTLPTPRTSG